MLIGYTFPIFAAFCLYDLALTQNSWHISLAVKERLNVNISLNFKTRAVN